MDDVTLLLRPGDAVALILVFGDREDDTDDVALRLRPGDAEYVESSVSPYILPRRSARDMKFIPI